MTGLLLAQVETQSAIIGGIVGLSIILARVIEKLVDNRKYVKAYGLWAAFPSQHYMSLGFEMWEVQG